MKQHHLSKSVFIIAATFLFIACEKKAEEQPDCKTCRAISNTVVEKQVCSSAEEEDFRNQNAGSEISCR